MFSRRNIIDGVLRTPLKVSKNGGVGVGDFADAFDRAEAVLELLSENEDRRPASGTRSLSRKE